ncbi:MAG: recombinase family protein [Symbiobacterium sp.]|uniref:recombinase family protein n=1 Tax=Symbiobacterium sp. TaxID=1971213 RepID=UPI003464C1CA
MGRTRSRRSSPSGELRRAAAYIRVSTGMQAEEGESLSAQQARLHAWAKENGYVIVREYVDAGESARTADRPQFVRMLQDAKAQPRPFDAVLVWKWDRFARNMEDASMYKALFRRRLGVELISITQPTPEGAVGQLLERMLDLIAEFQSALTAENVYSTMAYLAEQGRWLGKRPFGYDLQDGRLVVKPDEAEAVAWAFGMVARRERSVYAIAESFGMGSLFPATLNRGYRWSPTAVRKMLQNEVYLGRTVWNRRFTEIDNLGGTSTKVRGFRNQDEWITVENAHPAIIDKETFEAVQRVLREQSSRRPRSKRGEYLFWGMVRCARCGHHLTWHESKKSPARLICSEYFRPRHMACRPMVYIRPMELEEAVLGAIREIIAGTEQTPLTFATPKRAKTVTPEALLAANAAKVQRLLEAYEAGAITLDDLKTRRTILEQEAERLRQAAASKDSGPDYEAQVAALRERLTDVLAILQDEEAPVAAKNQALGAVIREIVIDREAQRIDIHWRPIEEDLQQ